ncbi:MAG: RluA family pseudouridine synthase [Magnetococcus sp. YQC-5]
MEAKLLEESIPVRLSVRRLLVVPDEAGMRLDRYLAGHNPGAPISLIQRWLRTGQVRVNGGRVRGGYRLAVNEEVRLPPFLSQSMPMDVEVPEWAIQNVRERILWRDEHILVLNKPHGIPVHGGSGQSWGSVDAVRAVLEREGHGVVPELCHRLDKETSGCLLFGLDKMTTRRLTEAFREGHIHKEYAVLVRGTPNQMAGVIEQPMVKGSLRGGERMVIATDRGGQEARTRYRLLERFAEVSLLMAWPETGRTHQIRVHFQWLGHPVVGDEKYGDPDLNRTMRQKGLRRMFLHAQRIEFMHPSTGKKRMIEAPMDAMLTQFLHNLAR